MPSRPIPNPMPNNSLVGDRALGDMSHLERADLLRRLQLLTGSEFNPSQRRRVAGRWFVRFLAVCCLVLIPWTAGLAVSLPRHYVASNWRLAWTFFDVALFCCLTVTAWALWKQRLIVVPASTITSVLLLCDAWFDIMTAHGHRDLVVSTASALVAELPLAVMLGLLSVRTQRLSARLARGLEPNAPISPLWRTPLFTSVDTSGHGLLGPTNPYATSDREFLAQGNRDNEMSGCLFNSSTRCCDSADVLANAHLVQPENQSRKSSKAKHNPPLDRPPSLSVRRGYSEPISTWSSWRAPP